VARYPAFNTDVAVGFNVAFKVRALANGVTGVADLFSGPFFFF
jgi:hypothetical protein